MWKSLYGRKKFKLEQEKPAFKKPEPKLSIDHLLNNFWETYPKIDKAKRIEILQILAEVKSPRKTNYSQMRSHIHPYKGDCKVCCKNEAFYHHHIITIKNGGRNQKKNLIPCCDSCHAQIHIWLSDEYKKLKTEAKILDQLFVATVEMPGL